MTVLALAAFSSSCNSHAYYDEARQYVDVMETVLIAAGQCDSAEDCRKKNLVFFEAGGTSIGPLHFGGVFVNVYEQSNPAILSRLQAELSSALSRIGGPSVTLTVYASRHLETKLVLNKLIVE